MHNAIMIALGKAKHPMGDDEDTEGDSGDESGDDISVNKLEMTAAKAAYNAKSEEEYAKALKAFFEACSMKEDY